VSALHADRGRAESFGEQAERYDRARPGYPPELVDALVAGGPRDVLDVGCGTGIVARALRARGCRVLGVEPDARMAAVARGHGVVVEEAAFEHWDDAGRRFDLVACGQAWHWVDPVRGAQRAAGVLRDGGLVGLFWNLGRPAGEAGAALAATYARLEPGLERHAVLLGHHDDRLEVTAAALGATARFDAPRIERWPWERTYATAEWLDQLVTHSDHAALPPERLERLLRAVAAALDRLGGGLTVRYDAALVSARAGGGAPPAAAWSASRR
jgi:SAM-dependent methyltransferase